MIDFGMACKFEEGKSLGMQAAADMAQVSLGSFGCGQVHE